MNLITLDYWLDESNWEKLVNHLESGEILKFDWNSKWLKGEEYFFILANMQKYVKLLNLETFELKTHPDSIYVEPKSK